jgi:hypothetical protein
VPETATESAPSRRAGVAVAAIASSAFVEKIRTTYLSPQSIARTHVRPFSAHTAGLIWRVTWNTSRRTDRRPCRGARPQINGATNQAPARGGRHGHLAAGARRDTSLVSARLAARIGINRPWGTWLRCRAATWSPSLSLMSIDREPRPRRHGIKNVSGASGCWGMARCKSFTRAQ